MTVNRTESFYDEYFPPFSSSGSSAEEEDGDYEYFSEQDEYTQSEDEYSGEDSDDSSYSTTSSFESDPDDEEEQDIQYHTEWALRRYDSNLTYRQQSWFSLLIPPFKTLFLLLVILFAMVMYSEELRFMRPSELYSSFTGRQLFTPATEYL
jgi:hypothetical protein